MTTDPRESRLEKLAALRKLGIDPYPHRYTLSHTVDRILTTFGPCSGQQLAEQKSSVRTAGRLMSLRGHGKVGFGHLAGSGEQVQIYVRQDRVGEDNYRLFKLLDIGDWIGVRGEMFRTRTGELTIFADGLDFLAKSLLPLPEKWHGLADVERRYRQRYLDLIANPQVREIFVTRSRIVAELRRELESHGYLEVETPMMQPVAGGAAARPFKTFHQALKMPLYLRVAPELYLKRLTVGGLERVYEINRNFRNEGISTQHNPEFTMLEFYVAYSDYRDLMEFTTDLLTRVVQRVRGKLNLTYGEHRIDFGRFHRYTMIEAILKFWEDDNPPTAEELLDEQHLRRRVSQVGGDQQSCPDRGALLGELFDKVAEPKLIQPTFIYNYPVELSPLAKRCDDDPRFVERFELYIAGVEIANAYSELNDPAEQLARFQQQLEVRGAGERETHLLDEDYLRALRHGLPPTGGEGLGVDRLTMILTNSSSIRDVILFPLLRPRQRREEEPKDLS